MREKAHSESEVTPRTEMVLQKVHDAEASRVRDSVNFNARITAVEATVARVDETVSKLSGVADQMSEHLRIDAARRVTAEATRKRRARVLATVWTFTAALIVAAFGAWIQNALTVNKNETVKQLAENTRQQIVSAQPPTEATYDNGFKAGAKAAVDEQLRRLEANPQPIGATRIAGRPPTR
jgi:hypothetical protein